MSDYVKINSDYIIKLYKDNNFIRVIECIDVPNEDGLKSMLGFLGATKIILLNKNNNEVVFEVESSN